MGNVQVDIEKCRNAGEGGSGSGSGTAGSSEQQDRTGWCNGLGP
jgi:hypothetical protein